MNQQNFKLSDFGIEAKPESRVANSPSDQCTSRRATTTTATAAANAAVQIGRHHHRYVHAENARVPQQLPTISSGRLAASGSNLLQVACSRSHGGPCNSAPLMTSDRGNNRHGSSPNPLGQMQNVTILSDRFPTSSGSPNSSVQSGSSPIIQLGSVPSPNCWKQYGGQESGVNIRRLMTAGLCVCRNIL